MYYLLLDQAQSGPFTLAQLIDMWQAKRIDALTLYWEEGNADWLPLHNIAPLLQVPSRATGSVPSLPASATPPSLPTANTAANEEIVWTSHPSLWDFAGEIFWGVILSVLLIGIFMLVHVFWTRKATRYQVTTRRVSVQTGIFTRSSRELRIADIRSIGARSNIFGLGVLEFSTAARAEAEVVFWGLRHVEEVRDMVKGLQNTQG